MATKVPLVVGSDGRHQQLQSGDTIPYDAAGAAAAAQAASQPLDATLTAISGVGTTGTGAVVLASALGSSVTEALVAGHVTLRVM